jgi:hypothetical protein
MRQRARIVLLAADGAKTRVFSRAIGRTTGTASKWAVRYAEHRLAGLARWRRAARATILPDHFQRLCPRELHFRSCCDAHSEPARGQRTKSLRDSRFAGGLRADLIKLTHPAPRKAKPPQSLTWIEDH